MNVTWSKYVQGIQTLYCSRKLRFDDVFAQQYKRFFALDENAPLKILEIGCGPGALAEALRRWYPKAEITAVDRDTEFIRFAKAHIPDVTFAEADITALPFDDDTFDITISNTVSEHVEPSKFYGEQYRVLRPDGICFVLSSRKGIHLSPAALAPGKEEQEFWDKISRFDRSMQEYKVCQYPMNEAEMPQAMTNFGFHNVSTGYAAVDLTPDDPKYPQSMARDMINAQRYCALEALDSALCTVPEHTCEEEVAVLKTIVNRRYDERLWDYDEGKKHWETSVSVIMMLRGNKNL